MCVCVCVSTGLSNTRHACLYRINQSFKAVVPNENTNTLSLHHFMLNSDISTLKMNQAAIKDYLTVK